MYEPYNSMHLFMKCWCLLSLPFKKSQVIQFIASYYRMDKIGLRRTRPNKRDYQVVIAVDDSRSMSESCCGDVAVEALVTVCRAVSQLEMGSLAVASFGTKGNINLLHDFDSPFTAESGVKVSRIYTSHSFFLY